MVLLVDDDEAIQELMGTLLSKHGITMRGASNGQDAMAQAVSLVPQVILLDIVLPGEDGFHILQKLKADPATKDVPVLIFSVLETPEHLERAKELGALDAIPKPFHIRQAVERIVNFLGG